MYAPGTSVLARPGAEPQQVNTAVATPNLLEVLGVSMQLGRSFTEAENDRNAPGRGFAPMELRARMGDNTRLARELAARMPNGKVEVYEGIGHLVHMEAVSRFNASVLAFLNAQR